jgi:cytochrome b561
MTTVTRYHPLLVALHWILAVLVIGNLAAGMFVLDAMANSDPAKAGMIRLHMLGGFAIGAFIVVRLLTRVTTKKPPPAKGGRAAHILARVTHWAFYLVIIGMVVSGLGTAQLAGLFPLLQGQPVDLSRINEVPPIQGHRILANVLLGLIALHLAGTLYHYLAQRENPLARMWFGKRAAE